MKKMWRNNIYTRMKIILSIILIGNAWAFEGVYANNTTYIMLSNQIARKAQLGMATNNMANAKTIGFEQDDILFKNVDLKQSAKKTDSFVYYNGSYRSGEQGSLRITNNPLDIAVAGKGYFKILTPGGEKYTLNGAMIINNDNTLVNAQGDPFASTDNQPIVIPGDAEDIFIAQDGTIYANGEDVGAVGVFTFEEKTNLRKEGNNLNAALGRDNLNEDAIIISGALRESNVNSIAGMTKMLELQKSAGLTNNLLSDMAELERSMLNKFSK